MAAEPAGSGPSVRLKVVCRREFSSTCSGKRIDIGVFELGDFAVLGDEVDDGMRAAQLVELAGGRAVAGFALFNPLCRQLQLIEQNVGQLARASRC